MQEQIFIINDNGKLIEMNEANFISEDVFQKLLENYPALLAGSQINKTNPRRWLMISREMGVPDTNDKSDRWSLDHLFIDQDAIPTLVEVKRKTDTRLRREVVGQMLDYAANAVKFWNVEKIKTIFEKNNNRTEENSEDIIANFLDAELEVNTFWESVETNLRIGRIRLLFVADLIPNELKTIIEYLNEQMSYTEVLGLELKQFKSNTLKTIVPRIVGKTSSSEVTKKTSSYYRKIWTEDSFLEAFKSNVNQLQFKAFKKLFEFSKNYSDKIKWGRGSKNGSMGVVFKHLCKRSTFSVWTYGALRFDSKWIWDNDELQEKYNTIVKEIHKNGVKIPYSMNNDISIDDWYEDVDVIIEGMKKYINVLAPE